CWGCAPGSRSPSDPFPVEARLAARAEEFEGALFADGVGAVENPVLPGGEPAEDARLHRLRPGEAQIGLHPGARVGREAAPLLEREADLVVPVELVGSEGDEAEIERARGVEMLPLR